MLVATAASPPQRSRVIALVHVLEIEHPKEATVLWSEVAVESIIGIFLRQERGIALDTSPSNFSTQHWIVGLV
jgi:hypothetical protein